MLARACAIVPTYTNVAVPLTTGVVVGVGIVGSLIPKLPATVTMNMLPNSGAGVII